MQKLFCVSQKFLKHLTDLIACIVALLSAVLCVFFFVLAGGRTFSGPLKSFFFVQFAIDSEIKLVLT